MNKTVDWFVMDYDGSLDDRLTPDLGENIDLCVWVRLEELVGQMREARRYLRGDVTRAIEEVLVGAVV